VRPPTCTPWAVCCINFSPGGRRSRRGPHTADVWVAASLNQCDGDAPMIIVALVSDRPIIELEDEQPTAFRLGRE
ncbi:hypothetical protein ACWD9X_39430, partial [Streptomyces sp. NPDC005075]